MSIAGPQQENLATTPIPTIGSIALITFIPWFHNGICAPCAKSPKIPPVWMNTTSVIPP